MATVSPAPTRARRQKWLAILLTLLLGGLLASISYFRGTLVEGIEFHPGTWQFRRFSFRADPLTGYQFTGVVHQPSGTPIDLSITQLLGKSVLPATDRWDLVEWRRGMQRNLGPAQIMALLLTRRFAWLTSPRPEWQEWTSRQPAKAALVWPAVQQLTVLELYHCVPELFELTQVEQSDQEFATRLDQAMGRILEEQASSLADLGDDRAAAVALVGLRYDPQNELLRQLAESTVTPALRSIAIENEGPSKEGFR